MNYDDLISHYGSAEKAAEACELTRQGVFRWKDREIPLEQQVKFEMLTGGALKANLPEGFREAAA